MPASPSAQPVRQPPAQPSAFALPDLAPGHPSSKADPSLIAADDAHLAAIAVALEHQTAELATRLEALRRTPGRGGQEALERDQDIHRTSARLRTLRRFGIDLCLGRMVPADGSDPVYVGRLGLTDGTGRRLLVDWRSPAAEPFFGATTAEPMGLASRRRYRWADARVSDYWDETFAVDGDAHLTPEARAALDDQSAFIASLGASRTERMRDVLATIAADQDAIVRAGSRGALVVDGGPGTGKTVVALHRAAYLLYSDPQLGEGRGGVLVVGPHQPYLDYVDDVLPSLGEEGVRTCTLRDLVPGGGAMPVEADDAVARLKADARMVAAIETGIRWYEEPPTEGREIGTEWADVWLSPADWAEAFATLEPGTPHNEAREAIAEALLDLLVDAHDGEVPAEVVRAALARNAELRSALERAWPMLEAADVVGDLWSVPAFLRLCAPWLTREEVAALQRSDPHAWTTSDLPLLDAARRRLGDAGAAQRRRRAAATIAADRAYMAGVVDDLIASDDSELAIMSMLRGDDLRNALDDEAALAAATRGGTTDPLAGPFAHIVVDEAQELTDAEWQMLISRCPLRSFTVVGDRAQARRGFAEPWRERLARVGLDAVTLASLSISYRTPREVMVEAEPVIRAALPDANVPIAVRASGVPVRRGTTAELASVLDAWLAENAAGVACVIGTPMFVAGWTESRAGRPRVRALTPVLAKGLEFDLVVLVDPEAWGEGVAGAVDRYVAMTRATSELVVLG